MDIDLHFERSVERTGHAGLENDEVPDLDRMKELQVVDGGGDEQAPGVPVPCDGAGDVNEVHDRPAEDEAEGIGVVRQHHLNHFGL